MLSLFGFGRLIYVCVLLLNAVAVLSEDRFLARVGWSRPNLQSQDASFGASASDSDSIKNKGIQLISAVRMMFRVPLIGINMFLIFYELLLG